MNEQNSRRTPATAIIIAAAAIIGIYMATDAYKYKYRQQKIITVTGAAEQSFTSDLIVWNASFSRTGYDLQAVYAALKNDEQKVRAYLHEMKLGEKEMIFSSVRTEKLFSTKYDPNGRITGSEFTGYQLIQSVKVTSGDISLVDRISREITGLIQQGVEMNSEPPAYYYTQLGPLKIDLLAKAAEDGKERAATIASHAGRSPGTLRKATMGIFQITGENENEEYSYGGTFNTSSLNKTATVTVRMEFAL